MDQYLGSKFSEKEEQDLVGAYASLSFSLTNNVFVETEFSGMSTGKTQFRDHYAGLGFNSNYVNGVVPFLSVGVNRIDAERRELEFSEYAPSAHVGFKYTPISFLTFTPSYRYSYVDKNTMNKYSLMGEINFTDFFAIELGASYKTYKESEQWSGVTGLKFYF
ncbi:hypothetical protein [Vibrio sp. SBT000027]|uniref:hypothetical protein n=1 Tax=Vibrio sp. SBT000027 TaxID=1803384 RepID=UPI00217EAB58|nr:hypothetical protein [Vibrio sp. SBT000027]